MKLGKWRKLNGDKIELPIKEAVEKTIIRETNAGHKLKVCIGTDSQVRGEITEFATVIVFLREKKGGFMYISAYGLCDLLDKYSVELEVHADINTDPSFQSNVALKEAMGYILGMGFVFKAKPDAFASKRSDL